MDPSNEAAVGDWDMTDWFPEFGGKAYRDFVSELRSELRALSEEAAGVDATPPDAFAELLVRVESANARLNHLGSYLGCIGAADARNEAIQSESAALSVSQSEQRKIFVALRAHLGALSKADFEALLAIPALEPVTYFVTRLRRRAAWSMAPELESLSAELDTTGLSAWGRLYDQVSGRLEFDLEVSGQPEKRLPVSMTRSLLEDPDPAVRRAALSGSNQAWESTADVTAAALNAIAGTRLLLYRRQGIEDFLDPALFDAGISRRTLDTLLGTVRERFEIPREFLRRKARLLDMERLGFEDLMAPLPLSSSVAIPYDQARERVLRAFGGFHPDLEGFARDAFQGRWIDHTPRPGKRPGGFCASSSLVGQSRIFMTYQGALGDVATLAHELGHAFHAFVMRDMRPWARRYPMTLAETASTFAEQLIIDAVLSDPEAAPEERAMLLDGRMGDAAAYLLNIPMRFEFERAFYRERGEGEVSVSRLKELMGEAQRDVYGDALDPERLDPFFWASKLHFYITGLSFYNFPYTFGYLFSLGIFARARREGAGFLPSYTRLLRLTGSHPAEVVAREGLGVELEEPGFWNESLDGIERDLAAFDEAVGAVELG
ncbi:MAG: M3 family oligoendopeptidase [Myxococcota bacterium]|nr:M3 family oligoendopeptidase [Myxococcota bacterium]